MTRSFLFDADFFDTKEAYELESQKGYEGIAIYLKLLAALRNAESHTLPNNPEFLNSLLRVSDCSEVLSLCLKLGLISEKKERVFSKQILDNMKRLAAKSEQAKKAADKRWHNNNLDICKRNANALQTQCERNADAMHDKKKNISLSKDNLLRNINTTTTNINLNTKNDLNNTNNKNNNIKYNNINNNKYISKDNLDLLEIPTCWNTETVREALKTWVEYKTLELREPYKTLASLKSLLTTLKKSNPTTELVVYAIDYAISRHWKGVALYKEVLESFNQNSSDNQPISRAEKYRREHPEEFDSEGNYIGKLN